MAHIYEGKSTAQKKNGQCLILIYNNSITNMELNEMNKNWLIAGGIVVLIIATVLDLMFQGLGYSLLPETIQKLVDNVFQN